MSRMREQEQGWLEFTAGLMHIVQDVFLQRLRAYHLPSLLALPSLTNSSCIVTGCTSGIGLQVAWELAKAGAHVVMACRSTKAAHELSRKWQDAQVETGGAQLNVEVMNLDLLSFASVRSFAEDWEAQQRPLHLLVNNAGIFSMGVSVKYSIDGFEEHLQVNHLSPALLTLLLMPALLRSGRARVVNVNSDMHRLGFCYPEDLNFISGKRKFSSVAGYCNSKLSQLLFSCALQKKIPLEAGVDIVAVHPGEVITNVVRSLPKFIQTSYRILMPFLLFTASEGARSVLFCSTDPEVEEYVRALKTSGMSFAAYFTSNCRPTKPGKHARDTKASAEIWQKTLEMLRLSEDEILSNFNKPLSTSQKM